MSFAIVGSAAATKLNTDLSDIWWNPAQSGWGMQLVNTGTFVFATIFTYGADGKPIWITGELAAGASYTFTGSTYINTGPYFGGPWNNAAVTQRKVGTMTFALTSVTTGQLTYSVDGVTVSTPVQRQSLTRDNFGGTYLGAMTYTISGCADTAKNVTASTSGQVTIVQDDTLAFLTLPIERGRHLLRQWHVFAARPNGPDRRDFQLHQRRKRQRPDVPDEQSTFHVHGARDAAESRDRVQPVRGSRRTDTAVTRGRRGCSTVAVAAPTGMDYW